MRPRLPLETLLNMISEIEYGDLFCARLVCRDFNFEASKIIFRAVYVGHQVYIADREFNPPVPSFSRSLKITSPGLADKLLAFQNHNREVQALYCYLTPYLLPDVLRILRNLLPSLENLRYLKLFDTTSCHPLQYCLQMSGGWRTVNLRYFSTNLIPDESAMAILDANPLIVGLELALYGNAREKNLLNISRIRGKIISLSLLLYSPWESREFDVLRHWDLRNLKLFPKLTVETLARLSPILGTLTCLRRLSITCTPGGDLPQFLRTLGSVVPQLDYLGIGDVAHAVMIELYASLRTLTNLTTLTANSYGTLTAASCVNVPRGIRKQSCPKFAVFIVNFYAANPSKAIIFWHNENTWYSKETCTQEDALWDDPFSWPDLEPWKGCNMEEVSCFPDSDSTEG